LNTPATQPDTGAQALTEALRLSFRVLRGLMVLLALAYLASGIFVVQQHERALVLRFGQVTGLGSDRIKEPGLHWTWPRPFSEIVRVETERMQTLDTRSFWYDRESDFQDNAGPGETLRPEADGYVVTGDANLLHSRWALRYTVADPYAYRFRFVDPETELRNELDRAVMQVSAQFSVDRALRTDLETYRSQVDRLLRARLDELGLGIRLQGVDVLAIAPPRQVAAAFDAVTQAAQERAQYISDAHAYAVRTVNEAAGDASRLRAEGESARRGRVSETKARADAFTSLYPKWKANPDVVGRTLLQDGIRRALLQVEQKYIVHGRSEGQEIRLHLGPEPRIMSEEIK
jgi:membrane protease subunit HflK